MPYFQGGFLRGMGVMGAIEECAKAQAEFDRHLSAVQSFQKNGEPKQGEAGYDTYQWHLQQYGIWSKRLQECSQAVANEKVKEAAEVAEKERQQGELLEQQSSGGTSSHPASAVMQQPNLPAVADWSRFMQPATLSPSRYSLDSGDSPMKKVGKVIGYAALIGGAAFVGLKVYKAVKSGKPTRQPEDDYDDEDEE